jgi:copper(I)-binding protein
LNTCFNPKQTDFTYKGTYKMSKLTASLFIVLISISLIAAQCGGAPAAPATGEQSTTPAGSVVKVMDPFARAAMPNGAVYMQLMNEGDTDDQLTSAASDVAEAVEIHETKMENDVMKMSPIEAVTVSAGGSATLEPGGKHVMLIGLKKELAVGDTFELTLNFKNSDPKTIEVEVKEGMSMAMDHGHNGDKMADGEMDGMDQ